MIRSQFIKHIKFVSRTFPVSIHNFEKRRKYFLLVLRYYEKWHQIMETYKELSESEREALEKEMQGEYMDIRVVHATFTRERERVSPKMFELASKKQKQGHHSTNETISFSSFSRQIGAAVDLPMVKKNSRDEPRL